MAGIAGEPAAWTRVRAQLHEDLDWELTALFICIETGCENCAHNPLISLKLRAETVDEVRDAES